MKKLSSVLPFAMLIVTLIPVAGIIGSGIAEEIHEEAKQNNQKQLVSTVIYSDKVCSTYFNNVNDPTVVEVCTNPPQP